MQMELDYVKLKQIKPALSGYVRESQSLLKKYDIPDEKVVHDVRVLMKKSRALLRLVAPQMEKAFNDVNANSLKEVGKIMRSWREISVLKKTLKEFKKKYPDIFPRLNENLIIARLLEKCEFLSQHTEEFRASFEQINTHLNKTGYRIRFQSMQSIDPSLLIKELEATYTIISEISILPVGIIQNLPCCMN